MDENKRLAVELAKEFIKRPDVKPILLHDEIRFVIDDNVNNSLNMKDIIEGFIIDLYNCQT